MSKKNLFLFVLLMIACFFCIDTSAQNRKAVGAKEVNGTYRDYFDGKFKKNYNEIKILALGRGKLKISFDLTYPHLTANGEMTANVGFGSGTAEISGDTAVYTDKEISEECRITIKFQTPGVIKVTQNGTDAECGFGFNVSADGTYKKFSGKTPKFNNNN